MNKRCLPLEKLDLSCTYMTDIGCKILAHSLNGMKTLDSLNLKGNAIDSSGA